MSERSSGVTTKLTAARTRLILERPFLGALVLRLPLREAGEWCKTTATDARSIYYNHDYIAALSPKQVQFMLAHDALHCALSHFARRQHRNQHRWDVACDFAINAMLVGEGMQPPADALYLQHFAGMTAEEIYPMLDEDEAREPLDQHLYDDEYEEESEGSQAEPENSPPSQQGGQGAQRPAPLSEGERQSLDTQWQQHLAGAAQQALQAGKLDGAMARLVDHFLQPQLPWRALLARYMTASARDDYSYIRPSSRRGCGAIFPALRSNEVVVVAAIDTSGSISEEEIREFVSEVDGLKGQIRATVTLLACDQEIVGEPQTFHSWEALEVDPAWIKGGRGTRFEPVFEWLEQEDRAPDLLLYFTDAEGRFPAMPPRVPVVWLVKGRQPVPWGERIQLNG
jgi:predicted metal-dependent peptidase